MTWRRGCAPRFFSINFAWVCEKESKMSLPLLSLLALPAAAAILYFSVADLLRAIPDSNDDFLCY
jgi:hypothetical protein